ncbi:MAG TPA: hypothetical protein VGO48_17925 [Conexibacter sp.]|jgi:hypothetical protein|nr:hypothetical protein [Conexibacter sp.]
MTITCPEPAAVATPAGDLQLHAEMAAAASCAAVLEEAGLCVTFDDQPDAALVIVLERPAGEPLRRLDVRELLALVTLPVAQVRAWAERPELPIPGSARR